jgi:hypothetical protein
MTETSSEKRFIGYRPVSTYGQILNVPLDRRMHVTGFRFNPLRHALFTTLQA